MILDTDAPGFSHTLIQTVGNFTAANYYDNVEVPADRLVGELNGGWKLITSQLNHERLGLGSWSDKVFGPFNRVLQWAKAKDEQGRRAVDQPWVRRALADCYTRMEAMRLINFRIAAELEQGRMDVALASTTKVYGSESVIEILHRLVEIVSASALERAGSRDALQVDGRDRAAGTRRLPTWRRPATQSRHEGRAAGGRRGRLWPVCAAESFYRGGQGRADAGAGRRGRRIF